MPINLGLSRISRLLAPIPQPWKAIHIAGTNGKGSVAFYLSHLLGRTGVRAGVFTTPHLIHPRESIKCVRGPPDSRGWTLPVPISKDEYDRHMLAARKSARELLNPDEEGEATEFEILTAAAFRAFAGGEDANGEPPIDIGVIECGVGGARDATNAMTAEKACTVITSLSFDHQALLGETLGEIATEKAGIMRENVPCYAALPVYRKGVKSGQDAKQAADALESAAILAGADLKYVTITAEKEAGLADCLQTQHMSHAVMNISLALRAFRRTCPDKALELSMSPGKKRLQEEYATMYKPPGRIQTLRLQPARPVKGPKIYHDVILDGAHNAEGGTTLSRYIKTAVRAALTRKAPVIWIIAMTQRRDINAFIQSLQIGKRDKVYAVTFPPVEDMPWVEPADPKDILYAVKRNFQVQTPPESWPTGASTDPRKDQVLTKLLEQIPPTGPVVVTGSLYLISYFLQVFGERVTEQVGEHWVHVPVVEPQV